MDQKSRHPKGGKAKILLTSVFGPYARDDKFGSRRRNPMELFHNQITREQGPFSVRFFHRSYGLLLMQANTDAPCAVLEFPDLKRFIKEIKGNHYDIVGISSIIMNFSKAKLMSKYIRKYLPRAKIIIGGPLAALPDLEKRLEVDHIVKGDGVRWLQEYLGQDASQPIKHPLLPSLSNARLFGISLPPRLYKTNGALMLTLGCPMGCDFCFTSSFFGGKGKSVEFFKSAEEIFLIMCKLERELKVDAFFIMDENFLLHKKRTMRLLELTRKYKKMWGLYYFASANYLKQYTMEELVALGSGWIWVGLEGNESLYQKLKDVNTKDLVRELQSHGIGVVASTIIGFDNHTMENIDSFIDEAIDHDADYHQFMLYLALPETALYKRVVKENRLFSEDELSLADAHGQYRLNYKHWNIPPRQETAILDGAFKKDYLVNGPSLVRVIRTKLEGYKNLYNHPDELIRRRIRKQRLFLSILSPAIVWAARKWFKRDKHLHAKMNRLLYAIYGEFGLISWFFAHLIGIFIHFTLKKEAERMEKGWTIDPPCIYTRANF